MYQIVNFHFIFYVIYNIELHGMIFVDLQLKKKFKIPIGLKLNQYLKYKIEFNSYLVVKRKTKVKIDKYR